MKLTDEELDEVCVTALEGGIGYWACLRNDLPKFEACAKAHPDLATSEVVAQRLREGNGSVVFEEEMEGVSGTPECWRLTLAKLEAGCDLFAKAQGKTVRQAIEDASFDSDAADLVFQYALLGKLIYG